MKRRTFLELSLLAPLFFKAGCTPKQTLFTDYHSATDKSFEFLEVKGSYKYIGKQAGIKFGKNIKYILNNRKEWLNGLLTFSGDGKGKEYSEKLFNAVKNHFPQFIEEIEGLAEGSGIEFKTLWAMSIKSELESLRSEPPGCSTVYYNDGTNNWLFHNEDGDVVYKDQMYMLKAHPPSGVSFVTLVYPGIIPGVGPGMNSAGVIQTSNFIGCLEPQIGMPRYFLGRAVLEAKSLQEAVSLATTRQRAFPWHHNLAYTKTGDYISLETLPIRKIGVNKPKGLYIHTNHLIDNNTVGYDNQDKEYINTSSLSRFEVLQEKAANAILPIKEPETILSWLSSHEKSPYSPCRHAVGDNTGQTLATAFFDIKKGAFRLYKGNPCTATANGWFKEYRI